MIGRLLRILTTNIGKWFETNAAEMSVMKVERTARIDDRNRRFESLTSELHQRFDRVGQELAEDRERMGRSRTYLTGSSRGAATATRRERNQPSGRTAGASTKNKVLLRDDRTMTRGTRARTNHTWRHMVFAITAVVALATTEATTAQTRLTGDDIER